MDPFHLAMALGPLSLYLLTLAGINRSRRPFLISGRRDGIGIALATMGLFLAGPFTLFMPRTGADWLGPWVWLALVVLYGLIALLVVLLMRPRMVIYNLGRGEAQQVLEQLVPQLDAEGRCWGDAVMLPKLGVQFTVEDHRTTRNIELVATRVEQDLGGWYQLQTALRQHLRDVTVSPNPIGNNCLFFAVVMAVAIAISAWGQPHEWTQGFDRFLNP